MTLAIEYEAGRLTVPLKAPKGKPAPYAIEPAERGMDALAWTVSTTTRKRPASYRVALDLIGHWRCECHAHRWHPNTPCKHVAAIRDLLEMTETLMAPPTKKTPNAPPTPDRAADRAAAEAPAETAEQALARRLREPFDPREIRWKAQAVRGDRAMAVAYVDARAVMDRLDEVQGVHGWRDSYQQLPDGAALCRLELLMPSGEWVAKEDVGGESEQPDKGDRAKAAVSDALKRAAVKWGVGRFLYHLPRVWVAYDPQKKQLKQTPTLPDWAMPGAKQPPPPPPEPEPAPDATPQPTATVVINGHHVAGPTPSPDAPQGKPHFYRMLVAYDAKLAGEGLCSVGDLVKHVATQGKARGYPADMTAWTETQISVARELTREFEAECRSQLV